MVDAPRILQVIGLGGLTLASACRPDIEGSSSLVSEPKVVALRSTPAEAAPGETVTYEALVVRNGAYTFEPTKLVWQTCSLRKPLTTSGAINVNCLNENSSGALRIGRGLDVETVISKEACDLFGPTPPKSESGDSTLRAADPDTTGGYYQPVTLSQEIENEKTYAIGVTRLNCGIGAATQAQVASFNRFYRPNENPNIDSITLDNGQDTETLHSPGTTSNLVVTEGKEIAIRVNWPKCPKTSKCGDGVCSIKESVDDCARDCAASNGCPGAEEYLMYDTASRSLVERHEQLRVSWYATEGRFDHERTSENVDENSNASENVWSAPFTKATVKLWVVIRDDRRGVGWWSFELRVRN
jgi:hypothetical protein